MTRPFSIDGLEPGGHRMYGAGVDAVQALQLGQVAIHAYLTARPEYRQRRLYWLEPNNPNGVGFPGSAWEATGMRKPRLKRSKARSRTRHLSPSGRAG